MSTEEKPFDHPDVVAAKAELDAAISRYLVVRGWDVFRSDEDDIPPEELPDAPVPMMLGNWVICSHTYGIGADGKTWDRYPMILSNPSMPAHILYGLLELHREQA